MCGDGRNSCVPELAWDGWYRVGDRDGDLRVDCGVGDGMTTEIVGLGIGGLKRFEGGVRNAMVWRLVGMRVVVAVSRGFCGGVDAVWVRA